MSNLGGYYIGLGAYSTRLGNKGTAKAENHVYKDARMSFPTNFAEVMSTPTRNYQGHQYMLY